MPTVLRERGFEVRIYTFDHPPPHVHVATAPSYGLISRRAVSQKSLPTFLTVNAKRAEQLVARHAERLKEEWARIHGKD
jgi:hypothetical protein